MKRNIRFSASRFTWSDIERVMKRHGVDTVWVCLDCDADALLVERIRETREMVICKGSVLGYFDGNPSGKFLLYRKCCEEEGIISDCVCVKDCVTCSFAWAAEVATGTRHSGAECWFKATPDSLSGHGMVDVAEDAPDNPFVDRSPVADVAP